MRRPEVGRGHGGKCVDLFLTHLRRSASEAAIGGFEFGGDLQFVHHQLIAGQPCPGSGCGLVSPHQGRAVLPTPMCRKQDQEPAKRQRGLLLDPETNLGVVPAGRP